MTTLVRKNQGWLPSVFNDLFEHPLFAQRMPINSPAINVKEEKCSRSKRRIIAVA